MFHSRDGLFFQREGSGSVRIIKTSDGKEPREDTNSTNILFMLVLAENEWGSVVCSVSKAGEDYARWMRARRFHGTDLPFAEHELKRTTQEELSPEQREWMDAPMGPIEHKRNTAPALIAGIDEMMTKLGYMIQEDRLVALAIVRENALINKALRDDHAAAYQRYKNELREISERHGERCNAEFKAHRQRLEASIKSINPETPTAE